MESDCIFCKVARREIQARIIDEDEMVVAFHDVNPKAPIHVLIIPKEHIPSVKDLDSRSASLLGNMALMANKVAAELNLSESGYRLVMNIGKEAGQTVYHIHMHLLGGRPLSWPPG